MKRILICACILPLLAACQEEVLSRRDSFSSQFSQWGKAGWAVEDPSHPKPAGPVSDPNVRVIREADFSHVQFNTNFQIDDPRFPQTRPATQPQPQGNPQQTITPWGAVPISPR